MCFYIHQRKIIKTFNAERIENKRFRELTQSIYMFCKKLFRSTDIQRPLIELMGAVGVGITVYFAIKTLPFDRFITFTGSLYILYEPVKKLSNINAIVQQTIANGTRIFEVLDTKPSIVDRPDAMVFSEDIEEVAFHDVSFSYD
ncbi:MAG: ABC transporter ATP-binding protein, partial [Candidatus Moranbacteria bacterium]|nr:ABC transporter ATP-binding protein [Candidatus Moranbacteria bacterium]